MQRAWCKGRLNQHTELDQTSQNALRAIAFRMISRPWVIAILSSGLRQLVGEQQHAVLLHQRLLRPASGWKFSIVVSHQDPPSPTPPPRSSHNEHRRGFLVWWNQLPVLCSIGSTLHFFSDAHYFTTVSMKFHPPSFPSFTRVPQGLSQAWFHICRCQYPLILLPSLTKGSEHL